MSELIQKGEIRPNQELYKKNRNNKNSAVHSIEGADKKPKEVTSWINDVAEIHKKKQPPSVSYSKTMPEIDNLMKVNLINLNNSQGMAPLNRRSIG